MKVVKFGRTRFMDAGLTDLSELALGGTAVGKGINTPGGYAQNIAVNLFK